MLIKDGLWIIKEKDMINGLFQIMEYVDKLDVKGLDVKQ